MSIQEFCGEIEKIYNARIIYYAEYDQIEINFDIVHIDIKLIYDGEQIRSTDFDNMILIIEDDIWRAENKLKGRKYREINNDN